jgi:hypothetical protein
MPGIVKVGYTTRTPDERAKELNHTGLPHKFKVEFAKLIQNVEEMEKAMHKLLSIYGERINEQREFFKFSKDRVHEFFDLLDGEYYVNNYVQPSRIKNPHKIYVVSKEGE